MRELAVGDTLDQYQVTALLARSGMASVFQAIDTESGKPVALKVPHLQFESDVVFFERFKREEEIGQRLEHPNIVKVLTPRGKSRMYLAMELAEGRSLREVMDETRPLPPERALAIAQQICEAVSYLHEHGVVHRDLKPENIVLTPGGQIKIMDFGIALDRAARRLTWAGLSNTLGTPDYLAPEQLGGRRGDARTDVYAVGTLLYEMLTGHLPFEGENAFVVMRDKASELPRALAYWVPAIDPALEGVVLRALETRPRDRQESAAALLRELHDPASVAARDPAARRRPRGIPRRLRLPLVVLAVLGALFALVIVSARARPEPARAAKGR